VNQALVEIVFMMGILKLPIVALLLLLWYAIRAEPRPLETAPLVEAEHAPTAGPCPWRRPRRRPPGSRGGSQRVAAGRRSRVSA